MAYLYRHIRLDKNVPFYIGISQRKNRPFINYGRNKIWKGIVSRTDYQVDILFDDLTWDEACKKEKEFIKLYGRIYDGGVLANMTLGGDGAIGIKRTQKSKDIISQLLTGKPRTKEVKDKISQKLKGTKMSEQFKENQRIKMIGNSYTSGNKLTIEHKNKISKAMKGNKKATTECPHCGIIGGVAVLKRFHFDKCKKK
jgi:hypothetical protein